MLQAAACARDKKEAEQPLATAHPKLLPSLQGIRVSSACARSQGTLSFNYIYYL